MEIFKKLLDYPNYAITTSGKVWSYKTGRFLKPDVIEKGYKRVTLYNSIGKKRFMLHRLVAEAFIPNVDYKPEVNHIDHNPKNNSINNLEWVTKSENQNKSNARYITRTQGERSNLSLLTEDRVDAIRCLLRNEFSIHKISRIFNTSRNCIQNIRDGKSWRHYNDK